MVFNSPLIIRRVSNDRGWNTSPSMGTRCNEWRPGIRGIFVIRDIAHVDVTWYHGGNCAVRDLFLTNVVCRTCRFGRFSELVTERVRGLSAKLGFPAQALTKNRVRCYRHCAP